MQIKNFFKSITLSIITVLVSVSIIFLIVKAGEIDSPATPSTDTGRMYTLEQIYQTITSGTTATKQSGGFTDPSSAPASTMHTLDEIYAKLVTGTTDAEVVNVLTGKTFIQRTAGNGETRTTGTMTNVGAQTITPTTTNTTITAGYHNGSGYCAGDSDLTAGNIATGVNLFGVTGTLNSGGLPKTGQTTSYATGDDGELEVGIVRSYTYSDDGSIDTEAENILTDEATGLMWIRNHTLVNGSGVGAGGNVNISAGMNWATALSRCNSLSYGGYDDWRLPNIHELYSISDLGAVAAPYINTTAFPGTSSTIYWSSTTRPGDGGYALYVYFSTGYMNTTSKTDSYLVRAVRGGQ